MADGPEFHLRRWHDPECQRVVEIIPVSEVGLETPLNRRGMLGGGLSVAAALAVLSACSGSPGDDAPSTTPPPPTTTVPPTTTTVPPTTTTVPTTTTTVRPATTTSRATTTTRAQATTTRPRPTTTRPATAPVVPGPPTGPRTTRVPCTPDPIPPGYVCTCNCVPER